MPGYCGAKDEWFDADAPGDAARGDVRLDLLVEIEVVLLGDDVDLGAGRLSPIPGCGRRAPHIAGRRSAWRRWSRRRTCRADPAASAAPAKRQTQGRRRKRRTAIRSSTSSLMPRHVPTADRPALLCASFICKEHFHDLVKQVAHRLFLSSRMRLCVYADENSWGEHGVSGRRTSRPLPRAGAGQGSRHPRAARRASMAG